MAGLHSHWVITTDGALPWKRDLSELRGRLGGIVYLTFCYGLLTDYYVARRFEFISLTIQSCYFRAF